MMNTPSPSTVMPLGGIGTPLSRVDGLAKVTGAARYAAEHTVPGLLYGWVVSSPVARGRLMAIDDTAARAVPGVVAVITHQNRPHLAWFDRSFKDDVAVPGSPFRALYNDELHFSGQPVALVVADTLEAARDAAVLVQLDIESASHNTNLDLAWAERFEPTRKRPMFPMPKSRGDAKAAFDSAPVQVSGNFHMPAHHHNPMETHACTVLWESDDCITVYDKTQGAQNVQAYLAAVFGFAKKNVRVLNPYVGGAFGSGLRPQYHVYLATLAAKLLQRSVRVVLTRQQMFTHVHRPEAVQSVALATNATGQLVSITNDATTVTSRFEHYMEVVCNWGLMAYACANASATYTLAEVDTYTPGDMRAPGAATGLTLFEMAMDEAAYAAGIDPLEFRRINYTEVDAMDHKPFTSKALKQAYDAGAERFGWQQRSPQPRSMREGTELIGWGMATGMWDAMFMKTSARARLLATGRLEVASAMADIGTGSYTVMTQVAAHTLGIAPDRIVAHLGDSSLPEAPVEGGSWGAASLGAAVELACQALGKKLLDAALKMEPNILGDAGPDEVACRAGCLVLRADATRSVPYVDILRSQGTVSMEAEETAKPGVTDLLSMVRKARNTHSAIFAEVKVDAQLGVVRVTRIVIAVAAGRIINPKTARSQIMGGVVMGIGMALHEESLLDHRFGRFMNHSLAEYHIPTQADIGEIEVIFVDEPDADVTPLGVKGVGEIGVVSTAAAVANAIFHATGTRVRSLPVTLDKLI